MQVANAVCFLTYMLAKTFETFAREIVAGFVVKIGGISSHARKGELAWEKVKSGLSLFFCAHKLPGTANALPPIQS